MNTDTPTPPAAPAAPVSTGETPVSTMSWVGTLILLSIPLVGFLLMIIWALGIGVCASKRNFCRASLILALFVCVIWALIAVLFFAFYGMNALPSMNELRNAIPQQ